MSQLAFDPNEHDLGFQLHAKSVFNRRFHGINTKIHSFALFLHPMCRELTTIQVANGRSFKFMFRVTMGIAKRWKWDKLKAKKLANNLQAYHQSVAPFAGAQGDGLLW
ncbi:hypothetical protein BDR06DRAFT_616715 [Suillus hirtellus]|nr:hypothetical protein BDR06DRAFT_616715 [Suillus hirtellus]